MKSVIEKVWIYLFTISFLILHWSCFQRSNHVESEGSSRLDSLIREAVNNSDQHDFEIYLIKLKYVIAEAEAIDDYRNQVLGNINI